ncbi:MAG: hypothetical protein KAS32_25705 [Candidatus Peribacteraceae bacterium]|nr:hypothetical protein [Candidatus Peribacteraceae bacterium]
MKGFWRTVESVFAIIMLMSFLLLVGSTYFIATAETDLSFVGYEALKELDTRGELRQYAVTGDGDSINSKISMRGFNHSISICRYGGTCTGQYPDAEDVIVSNYIISGHNSYDPLVVRLYAWRRT